MEQQEDERAATRPELALRRAGAEEDEVIFVLALEPTPSAPPPLSPEPGDRHAPFHGLLADASHQDLLALRHLLACPLCRELARVVLLEIPARERRRGVAGAAPGAIPSCRRS